VGGRTRPPAEPPISAVLAHQAKHAKITGFTARPRVATRPSCLARKLVLSSRRNGIQFRAREPRDVELSLSINVRVREAVDYVTSNCNPNCPTAKKNAQCENPFNPTLPVTVIFDSPNLNWCGCATTSSPDPSKQTVGYSGRCSQGAGDYYTKYKDLATQICNRA